MLDARPDVVSILVGVNDMGWHTLVAADGMFAELAAATGPEYWAADGVHPTPAGHAALASAWLRLVA
ncbi:hypothetical protein [Streptomyces sp. BP-8]|uniref:SGNH hydrolase-type esterase domain-containing protein n=1 Tax=Streptomyces sirii TaxID=3127701 RepID=A0ABZ2QHW7_9ACTN